MLIEAILSLVIIKLTTQVKSKSFNFEFKLQPPLADNSVYWLHFNTPFLYVIYKCILLIYITLTQVDSIVYNTHDFDYFCVCDSINQFCWNQYFQQPFSLTFTYIYTQFSDTFEYIKRKFQEDVRETGSALLRHTIIHESTIFGYIHIFITYT